MNSQIIKLGDKDLNLNLSDSAVDAINSQKDNLYIEMELYYSCMIGKRVNIRTEPHKDTVATSALNDRVNICFRAMMTRVCTGTEDERVPDRETFPVERPERYLPSWLKLDFKNGNSSGEFGI